MSIHAFAALEWKPAPMPGSNGPVQLAQLSALADGAFRAFVRFPAGWERPGAGHYAVAEEFLVLQGDLGMDGRTWREGAYAWIAARRTRTGSRSVGGCLAFAWFGGAPRWRPGDATTPAVDADVRFEHWRDAPASRRPRGAEIRLLRAGPEHTSCIVDAPASATLENLPPGEWLGLTDYAWCADSADAVVAKWTGAVFVRHRTAQ